MAGFVTRVYAEAWYEAAVEAGKVEQIRKDAETLLKLLEEYPRWQALLETPVLSAEEKETLLDQAFGSSNVDGILCNLLKLLVKNHRTEATAAILRQGISYCKKSSGILSAVVISAEALGEGQKKQVQKRLTETAGCREIEIEYVCDSSLIGGLAVLMENRLADGSVRGRIRKLAKSLTKNLTKSFEEQ